MRIVKILFIVFVMCFYSCEKKGNKIEIEKKIILTILNDTIYSLDSEKFDVYKLANEDYIKKGKNIIRFKIKNNSNEKIYFNFSTDYLRMNKHKSISTLVGDIIVYNSNNEEVDCGYETGMIFETNGVFYSIDNFILNKLNYADFLQPNYTIKKNSNFVIFPNQTKFFETFIYLPMGDEYSQFKLPITEKDSFFIKMILYSEGLNKNKNNNLSQSQLNEIESNSYLVFDGNLLSNNKVPIKVIK